jgi:hypothetical protein
MRRVLAFSGVLGFFLNYFYIAYGSDDLGSITGVFVALYIVPFIGWALLTIGFVLLMRIRPFAKMGKYWIWLLLSIFCAYLPVFLVWIAFSSV